MPYFCQPNSLNTPATAPGEQGCRDGSRKIQAGNIGSVIQAITAALGKNAKLTLSQDGNRILISCETKCGGDALQIVQATISKTARPVPAFVHDIEVPRGTAELEARSLQSSGLRAIALTDSRVRLTSEVPVPESDLAAWRERAREAGFGAPSAPPVQRLFYRSAPAVVGDLLSTPSAVAPPVLGGNAATAPVTGNAPAAAGSGTGESTTAAATTISITNNAPAAGGSGGGGASSGPAPTGDSGKV